MLVVAWIAFIFVAEPVAGQDSTTICDRNIGVTTCKSHTESSDASANMLKSLTAERNAAGITSEQLRYNEASRRIGELVIEGRCDDAARAAEFYGFPVLKSRVAKACVSKKRD